MVIRVFNVRMVQDGTGNLLVFPPGKDWEGKGMSLDQWNASACSFLFLPA